MNKACYCILIQEEHKDEHATRVSAARHGARQFSQARAWYGLFPFRVRDGPKHVACQA